MGLLCRHRGIGNKLLAACENEVKESDSGEVLLAVHKENASAISFYEKHGYAKIPDSNYTVTDEGGEGSEGQENFYMIKKFKV